MNYPTDWLAQVRACDQRAEELRQAQAAIADERAHLINGAVGAYGRGGRDWAAAQIGVNVLQVDAAIKRARTRPRPHGLPHDLLGRLYALELADVPPLPARLWQALARVLAGTFVDAAWVEQPGRLLAQEVDDSIGDGLDDADGKRLAEAARSWTRPQALAVIDAIARRDLNALPTAA